MNNSPKILLLNRMLGYDGLNTALKGYSGRAYGSLSRYSPEHKCHVVELSLAEYESAREDIFKKMRQGMSGFLIWEPKIVLADALPAAPAVPAPTALSGNPPVTSFNADLPPKGRVKAAKAAGAKRKKRRRPQDPLAALPGQPAAQTPPIAAV